MGYQVALRKKERKMMLKSILNSRQALAKLLFSGVVVFGALGITSAMAQSTPSETVIATVGDESITELELSYMLEDIGKDIEGIPAAERRQFLIQMIVDMKVLAQAARKAGMADTDVFVRRKQFLEDRALRRAYLQVEMGVEPSPEEIKTAYDAAFSDFQAKEMLRASHILVTTEADALAIVSELNNGRDFGEVAKEKSTGPSGPNGGDLGYFSEGDMVVEFYDGARALEIGAHSAPVQSQFGWHVIKLVDRRPSTPPALEQVYGQIQQQVMVKKFEDIVADLKKEADIKIVGAGN